MTEVGAALEEARSEINLSAVEFMSDLCDIISVVRTADNYGGTTSVSSTTASNVPCSYKPLSERDLRVAGTVLADVTHKIKLPSNSFTEAIKVTDKITVHARGNTPAFTFTRPVSLDDSHGVFVYLAASIEK